ncbi:MAG: Hsp20/alpha crystallin family protein [Nocardioidaceae bacterium]
MAKSHPHPFRGFLDMMSEMERVRNVGRRGSESGQESTARTHATAWVPTTDIFARAQDLVISAEIAGVPPRDIDISVSEGVLTISGERQGYPDDADVTPYVRERYYGAFRRSMVLPDGVDEQRISASFDGGVVTITVPDAVAESVPTPHRIQLGEG